MKRILAIALGVGLVAVIGWRVWEAGEQQAGGQRPGKKKLGRVVRVEITESRIGKLRDNLLLTGALKPTEQVDVTPKDTGRVEQIVFKVGDTVREGDLVAVFEDDELQQQVHSAEAAMTVAGATLSQRRAELRNAQAELERAKMLVEENLLSAQEFEAQETSFDVVTAQLKFAQAQIEQAQAALRELRIRLAQTQIYAPISGIVATRYVDQGALVSPTTPVLRIVNLSTMVILTNVPERGIGRLRVGNEAKIHVDAIPDREFVGRVTRIAPVLDSATRTAVVEIDIPNPQRTLKAEMFARIRLDLGTTREALLIPRDALVYRGQQPGVYLVDGDRPTYHPIETDLAQEGWVEVVANLEPGVRVVGRGSTMLRDGDRISAADARPVAEGPTDEAGEERAGRGKAGSTRGGGPKGKLSRGAQ